MKLETLERLAAPARRRLSTYLFVPEGHEHGDAIYVGSERGLLSVFLLPPEGHSLKHIKAEDLGVEPAPGGEEGLNPALHHTSKVTVLMHSKSPKLSSSSPTVHNHGLLFSGSSDRSVRVWNHKTLVQSLPHSATVLGIADGHDGSVVSICIDGMVRVWAPQKGRHMMLNPFFVCTFHLCALDGPKHGGRESWISALALNTYGSWSAFVGESDGSISVFRKSNVDTTDMEDHVACPASPLVRKKRWERVHSIGITILQVLPDENYLVALASDGCCKILDAIIGTTILSFGNSRKCAFTGLSWLSSESTLFLTDELGFVQAYNVGREKNVDSVQLAKPNRKQLTKIAASHQEQALGGITHYRGSMHRTFFVLLMPYTTKTVQATMSTNTMAKPKHDDKEDLASYGEIALVRVVTDTKLVEFIGHEGTVIGISTNPAASLGGGAGGEVSDLNSPGKPNHHRRAEGEEVAVPSSKASSAATKLKSADAAASAAAADRQMLRVSREESAFFSVGSDSTIRCWDEFDASESYQFKSKSPSEFTASRMLWNMNCLATGHESGTVMLWNSDSGTHVVSRGALQNSVTCIVEARNSRSHLLVGSDFSGNIGIWNLTQYRTNPVKLPVENVFQCAHDPEEPGVLSLAFHALSNTFFSGGVDRVIKVWKLNVEFTASLTLHSEPVCCLECSDGYLLSGDEAGDILLWRISLPDKGVASSGAAASMPRLSPVCRWFAPKDEPSRSVGTLLQVSPEKLYVVQAGRGGRTFIWEVWAESERGGGGGGSGSGSSEAKPSVGDADGDEATGLEASLGSLSVSPGEEEAPLFRILSDATPEFRVTVSTYLDLDHENEYEVSCVQLVCDDAGDAKFLYLGTSAGNIRRVEVVM